MKKAFYLCGISILCIVVVVSLQTEKPSHFEETPLVLSNEMSTVPAQAGMSVIGHVSAPHAKEEGLFLLGANAPLQVFYHSVSEPACEPVCAYQSTHPTVAHHAYSLDSLHTLLLEMYYNEEQTLSFCLTRIGIPQLGGQSTTVYQGPCDRMPYVAVVDLKDSPEAHTLSPHILFNYEHQGESRLLLFGLYAGSVDPPVVVSSGMSYSYPEHQIETGRKVAFAGGHGNYVYYQVLYNTVGDPHPEVSTFEAIGVPILYRYNIHSEEIERVARLDKIAIHLNASQNYVLLSEYDYAEPLSESGKILSLKHQQEMSIVPGVESGNDILNSRFIDEEHLVIHTPQMLYFVDLERSAIYTCEPADHAVLLSSDCVLLANTSASSQIRYQRIQYSDIFSSL